YVDEAYDEGRPIAQWPVPVFPDDSPETLAARVLRVEHQLYPIALERLVRELQGQEPLPQPEFKFVAAPHDVPALEGMRTAFGLQEEEWDAERADQRLGQDRCRPVCSRAARARLESAVHGRDGAHAARCRTARAGCQRRDEAPGDDGRP